MQTTEDRLERRSESSHYAEDGPLDAVAEPAGPTESHDHGRLSE